MVFMSKSHVSRGKGKKIAAKSMACMYIMKTVALKFLRFHCIIKGFLCMMPLTLHKKKAEIDWMALG